jgi:hypothetical protein
MSVFTTVRQELALLGARIDGKLDVIIAGQSAHTTTLDDHEGRIRRLEKAVWQMAAVGSASGLVTGIASVLVTHLIGAH